MPSKKASSAGNQQERPTFWENRVMIGGALVAGLIPGFIIKEEFLRAWIKPQENSNLIEILTLVIAAIIALPTYLLLRKLLFPTK